MRKRAYLHSPFCETIEKHESRFLLIQFILQEIFLSHSLCKKENPEILLSLQTFSPLCLSTLIQSAPLDRIQEHASLIPLAFPDKKDESFIFSHSLSNTVNLLYNLGKCACLPKTFSSQVTGYLRQMFFLLEPFMEECKNEGAFLFFLLSRQEDIGLLSHPKYLSSFLNKLYPKGLPFIQERVCDHFYKKGFPYLIPKVKTLIKQLKKAELA